MFLDTSARSLIVERATNDVLDSLQSREGSGEFHWTEADAEVRQISTRFPVCNTLKDFVHDFFRWLDANPTIATEAKPYNREIRRFLLELYHWLECFASANEELPEFFGTSHIFDFGHFVASKLNRKLHWSNTKSGKALKGYPKDEFVSWMIVMDNTNIHIIYDENRIQLDSNNQKRPNFLVQQIFERVLLHELGHACLQLSDYGANMPGWKCQPKHETEAWLYATFIRALAISTRARIERYLGQSDSAYVQG